MSVLRIQTPPKRRPGPVERLERAAKAAHRRGVGWSAFEAEHRAEIAAAEPWNLARWRRLTARLRELGP